MIVSDKDLRAVTESGFGSWAKGGANKWYRQADKPLGTFSEHPSTANSLIVASGSTQSPEFVIYNALTGNEVKKVPSPSRVTHLRASYNLLVSAASDGNIRTHDFRAASRKDDGFGATQSSAFAHAGGVQDLEVSGNYVYSCGWSFGQARPLLDPLVKVYDIRTMRTLAPIQFSQGATHVNVHPKKSSSLVVTSAQGLVAVIDLLNPVSGNEYHQLGIASYVSAVAVNPTGSYIAFGDADGYIHMITSGSGEERIPWNGFDGQPPPWPDQPDPLPDIHWTDTTPLNSIGMPYYDSPLLSGTSAVLLGGPSYCPPPPKVPDQVLKTMRVHDFVGYATLPKELRGKRNVVETAPAVKDEGRFRSTQHKKDFRSPTTSPTLSTFPRPEIPDHWRKTDIKYSKFGIEDFDFGYYNKTVYSGLETHIMNSYTNAIIQALFFTILVREHAKSHITTPCMIEHCLLCELGFLSRMLEDARGTNCQASNFCKVIGRKAQATALGLIDWVTDGPSPDYANMIQQFNRFAMEEMSGEGNMAPNPAIVPTTQGKHPSSIPSPITQFFGIQSKTVLTCGSCGATTERSGSTHVVDLTELATSGISSFSDLLSTSLQRESSYKATCQFCRSTTSLGSKRVIPFENLPTLLTVNASAFSDDNVSMWMDKRTPTGTQRFLEPEAVVSFSEHDSEANGNSESSTIKYTVRAVVYEVRAGAKSKHLVTVVRVPEAERRNSAGSAWYLFNDFVVRRISEEEALECSGSWKVPCILFLERVDYMNKLDLSGLPSKQDRNILTQQQSISRYTDPQSQKHKVLGLDELPTPGTVVAIDAEFVALQQEESELRSDGTKKVLRPSQLTLARVSVLRGMGSQNGTPFIDDYIHTTDTIVDYLTEYSGIRFGDLDPQMSRHTLLPLKVVYKKLRLLVDLGCIFVGHGLPKDFRTINLFVPPEQVIDTVDLYFVKARQRRLSLRFLSWYVLKEPIQAVTHDSIEDARAALLLYEKYQEYEEEGKFDDILEEIYREGKKVNFKPPQAQPEPEPSPPPATNNLPLAMQPPYSYHQQQAFTGFLSPQPAPYSFAHLAALQYQQPWNTHNGSQRR
ncbi:poly(A)-specific ribonuclease [Tulasnella sp. 403]|nr:poly(A)-specific ribonuclease [Tulasnella sp. 403]